MNALLLFIVVACFVINLSAPNDLCNADAFVLSGEFIITLWTSRRLIDNLLVCYGMAFRNRIYSFFLLFLSLSLVYLHFCWTPYLSTSNPDWGFDPQRYYYYASQLSTNQSIEYSMNWNGIVVVYEHLFRLFGVDPMVPLFINVVLILLALCLVLKLVIQQNCSYRIIKYLPYSIFLPELIFYSTLSSREIICMSSVIISLYLYCQLQQTSKKMYFFYFVVTCLFVVFVRPHFGLAIIISCILDMFLNGSKFTMPTKIISLIALAICFFFIYSVSSDVLTLIGSAEEIISGANQLDADLNYSSNSIAAKLIPHGPLEFVVYGFLRSTLYLIPKASPLIMFNLKSAYAFGDNILVYITSIIFMVSIPTLLWGAKNYMKLQLFTKTTFLFFVVYFLMVGMFNTTFIQDRYRIVYDMLLILTWSCLYVEKYRIHGHV